MNNSKSGEKASVMLELFPPPEHANKSLHWVLTPVLGHPTVALLSYSTESSDWSWRFLEGGMTSCSIVDAYTAGCRYLGPAEWRTPEPRSEVPKSAGHMEYVSLATQARLVEIAHGTTNAVIAEAAIRILAACAVPSEPPA